MFLQVCCPALTAYDFMNHPQDNLHKWEEPAKIGPFILSNELKQQRLDICFTLSREVGQNKAFFREIVISDEM